MRPADRPLARNPVRPVLALVTAAISAAGALSPTATADFALPACPRSATVINPESVLPHQDCRLHSGDGLNFDITHWSADAGQPPQAVKVVVTDGTGETVQTINEMLEPSSPSPVGLQDLDGDGRDELVVPLARHSFNGSPNTRFAVWRADGDRQHLERTQMVGQAVYPSGDGYVVSNGGALSSRDLTFYLPTGAGFTLVVVLTMEAEQVDADSHRVLTVSCRAHQEDGLHAIDMDVYQAEDTFCASPAANAIWPGAERVTIRPWPRWGQ
ncbi:hypothetical protein [Mycobacterium talmoniae]|uniref:Alpha integrin n=1 Tax=Mycobacterium talmoniae TaxID=1858794 RepID=A0A1S1NGU1_9MYCO|nr:hypothetical protein [Mycobacterium talmoniae]OHV01581.1 hypothetical protein BKN37_16860 [Mycobacterium talmoniae]PQM49192.1 hypothetical protein C1Y40_00583 [Mycobacterium talmoniae]